MLLEITTVAEAVPKAEELCEAARWEEAFALLDRLEPLIVDDIELARVKLARVRAMSDLDWTRGLRDPAVKQMVLDEVEAVVTGRSTELEALLAYERGMALHLEFIMAEGDPDRELASFTRAAELFGELGDTENAALATSFIGIFHHVDRLDRDAAFPVLQRAYAMSVPARGSEARSEAARHLGQIYQERGDYEAALPLLKESLAARAELGDTRHLASALHAIGYVYLEMGDLGSAEDYLSRARVLADRFGSQLFGAMIAKAEADLALRKIVGPNIAGRTHP